MKLYPFLFLNFSHGQELSGDLELARNGIGQEWCTVQRAVHLCRDDTDLKYRQCLGKFVFLLIGAPITIHFSGIWLLWRRYNH